MSDNIVLAAIPFHLDAAELAAKIHLPEEDAELGCVVNRFVLYYANVKKGYRENGECIRTT